MLEGFGGNSSVPSPAGDRALSRSGAQGHSCSSHTGGHVLYTTAALFHLSLFPVRGYCAPRAILQQAVAKLTHQGRSGRSVSYTPGFGVKSLSAGEMPHVDPWRDDQ